MTKPVIYFALRHKPTQKLMPARMTKAGRAGWSWWDPTDPDNSGVGPQPRLFTTPVAVKNAAAMWLKGTARSVTSTDWESGHTEIEGITFDRVKARKREDLEMVEYELVPKSVKPI